MHWNCTNVLLPLSTIESTFFKTVTLTTWLSKEHVPCCVTKCENKYGIERLPWRQLLLLFSCKVKVKVKSLSHVQLFATPWTVACIRLLRPCSVAKSCSNLCDPMDCNMPGFSVIHCRPEFAQIHVHWVGDANHLTFCCPLGISN